MLNLELLREIATKCGLRLSDSLELPARQAIFRAVPDRLHLNVLDVLSRDFPSGLYGHQAAALEALLDGNDVTLSTPTASGKSLVFITAALDILCKDPVAKVLAIYPAKALIRDQIAKWEAALRTTNFNVALIDGTVQLDLRADLLEASQIILMTPDVLHAWFMSHVRDRQVTAFRRALRLVILDEAHVYEGVFGTNMAYLMRRLDAVAGAHQVLCSTATLGEPADFIYQLTGRAVTSIGPEMDGSPAPERHILLSSDPGYELACPHLPHTNNTQLAAAVAVGK